VTTNRLLSASYSRKTRRVPAHMPHMIDSVAMGKLQEKYASEYARTAAQPFRTSGDVQYAFAYFHFLLEGGAREGLDVARYFALELDADGDGVLNENELRTLGAVVYKRGPSDGELAALRACLVGEAPAAALETTVRALPGGRTVETTRTLFIRDVTWDTIMACPMVPEALSRNARFGPTAQDMGPNADKEEVAFEMLGDDYNKTLEQLDAVRGRRPKFLCINDNMREAAPRVLRALSDFLESYYAQPCPMELRGGAVNGELYIAPLRAALAGARLGGYVWAASAAVAAALVVGGAAAAALARHQRAGKRPRGSGGGALGEGSE
jgi:hypothetical protein